MAASVTLKMSPSDFDLLREAVKLTAKEAGKTWRELKKAEKEEYRKWYTVEAEFNRLLKHTLT
jgi:hypothetical protein